MIKELIKPLRTGFILFGFLFANQLIQFHNLTISNLYYIFGLSLMAFIIEIARFYHINLNQLTATTKKIYSFTPMIF